jgi:pimeloyl-ACP methyl ester carboxylesterase
MPTPTLTDKPTRTAELAPTTPAAETPPPAERRGRGHIGLTVLGSILAGLVLGLVLVLGVFGGSEEATITGAALIALGVGMLILFLLAGRRTDQPQPWALASAIVLGAIGFALLILRPGDRLLGWMGWVWPILLALLVVWSVRGARRSLHNWSRRWLLYPAFAVLGLVALGGAYETIAEPTTSNPAPSAGRTYVVEGHRLYLNCVGSGSPTVVLFNGHSARTPNWVLVQSAVARQTRVCAYDRAGQGWSGKAPRGRQDGHELAADVHGLLSAADFPGPYVLAGHSTGGTYALAYAMDYPEETAGVALIDSASPHQFDLPDYPGFYSMWRRVGALLPSLGRVGVPRLTSGLGSGDLPSEADRAARAFYSSPRELRANHEEFSALRTVFGQTKALTSLDGKPLFVLTAGVGQQKGWSAAQEKLATLSTNSRHQTAQGATHTALLEETEFASVTSGAIGEVVQAARSGQTIG